MKIRLPSGKVFFNYQGIPDSSDERLLKIKQLINNWEQQQPTLIQSSGSTGEPKVLEFSFDELIGNASLSNRFFQASKDWVFTHCLDLNTTGGIMLLFRAYSLEADLNLLPVKRDPLEDFAELPSSDYISLSPLQLQTLLSDQGKTTWLKKHTVILIGGAEISPSLESLLLEKGIAGYHTYGMTETLSHVAIRKVGPVTIEPFFSPLPTIDIKTTDESRVLINAPYLKNTPVLSNDLGRITSDGKLEYLGRADRVINSGGVKISLPRVESVFKRHFPNQEVIAFGTNDIKLGTTLLVAIEGKQIKQSQRYFSLIKDELPKYWFPKKIIWLPEFPRTATDKINLPKLIQLTEEDVK